MEDNFNKEEELINRYRDARNDGTFEGEFEDFLVREIIDLENTICQMDNLLEINDALSKGSEKLQLLQTTDNIRNQDKK